MVEPATNKTLSVDDAFPGATPHEITLFKAGLFRWMAEIQQIYQPANVQGNYKEYDIDFAHSPVIEVCDEYWVREFRAELDGDEVRYSLSDPVRPVDPGRDPQIEDHTRAVYPNGPPISRDRFPERLLAGAAFLIQRRNRESVVGDLREDLHEMRHARYREKTLTLFLLWHLAIAAICRAGPVLRAVGAMMNLQRSIRRWLAG